MVGQQQCANNSDERGRSTAMLNGTAACEVARQGVVLHRRRVYWAWHAGRSAPYQRLYQSAARSPSGEKMNGASQLGGGALTFWVGPAKLKAQYIAADACLCEDVHACRETGRRARSRAWQIVEQASACRSRAGLFVPASSAATSAREGSAGCAPARVVESAPAAMPQRSAAAKLSPPSSAAASPPLKASPAATCRLRVRETPAARRTAAPRQYPRAPSDHAAHAARQQRLGGALQRGSPSSAKPTSAAVSVCLGDDVGGA